MMLTIARPIRSGDTTGEVMTVRLPESTIRADRVGGWWVVNLGGNQAHRLLSRSKHWRVIDQSIDPVVEEEPVVEEDEPVSYPILQGTVSDLEEELEFGIHDDNLDSLLSAEEAGKNRSTAVRAIRDRMEEIE